MPRMGDIEKFVQSIPKVELHCHLFGAVRRATFTEFVQRAQAPIADADIAAFYDGAASRPPAVLQALQALQAAHVPLLRQPDDLYRLTLEYLQDARAHEVRYAEFCWHPLATARGAGIPYPTALSAIVRAIRDAEPLGIVGRLVPAIARDASPAEALEVVRWAGTWRCDEVVGVAIDDGAHDRPPELFAEACALARRQGLRTSVHAGAFGRPWTQVQSALDLLHADRVDHGYAVVEAPDLAAACAERGVVFTVVPTHAEAPAAAAPDHPLRRMPALGLRVHPNTGGPALHRATPTRAWLAMAQDFGHGVDALRSFMLNGLDGAWIDAGTRARWRREFGSAFDALRSPA